MDRTRPTRAVIVAAEPSGDVHAGQLVRAVRELRPDVSFSGFGGPHLEAAGCRVHEDLTTRASMVLGFTRHLKRYAGVLRRFDTLLEELAPACVVLVDSPGLNFLLARLARWSRVPVVYYICPQIWAWAPWRRSKVLDWCDLLMPILPFEEELYRNARVPVAPAGHPVADELAALPADLGERLRESLGVPAATCAVGVFPGSRRREVEALLPCCLRILKRLDLHGGQEVVVSCCREEFLPAIERARAEQGIALKIVSGDARPLMMACDLALVASGTASLELAYFEKPMLVLYRAGWLGYHLFRYFSVTPWIALPNILGHAASGGEATVPEKLFWRDPVEELLPQVRALVEDREERGRARERLRRLKEAVFRPGGVPAAAARLVTFLEGLEAREAARAGGARP